MNIVQVYKQFPDQESCIKHLEQIRWKGTPVCPYCGSERTSKVPSRQRHICKTCNNSFSVTVGTIFHNSKLPLQKWFLAITLILNAKKGISSMQLMRDLEVNWNTAWLLQMRIREAMKDNGDELLSGIVEIDETYVSTGKNASLEATGKGKQGRSLQNQTPVLAAVERGGEAKVKVIKNAKKKTIKPVVDKWLGETKEIVTDSFASYTKMFGEALHSVVNHSKGEFAREHAHTNTAESFFSLIKRGLIGQYHKLSQRHLQTYMDEFAFRYTYKNQDMFGLLLGRTMETPRTYTAKMRSRLAAA